MHYLVTGGAGFIGSNLVDALLAAGHQVRILDNFSTGKQSNVAAGVEVVEADMTNLDAIRPAFVGIDGVFHCAALPRIPFSIEHPVESFYANTLGTLHVLEAAREAKVKRVVYSASSSAYGNQDRMPQTPDMCPNPMNPYAMQKYVGEMLCTQFHQFCGLETVSLRYFNVYGPRMASDGAYVTVIAIFIRQHKAGEPLTIHGDGGQTRDFTHVSDVVAANIAAMASPKAGKGDIVNVGAGANHSVSEVAAIIGGSSVHVEGRTAEARDSLADISLTKELLGWEPKMTFEDGLRALLRSEGIEPAA